MRCVPCVSDLSVEKLSTDGIYKPVDGRPYSACQVLNQKITIDLDLMLRRILNQSFSRRYYQAMNGLIVSLAGKQLGVIHLAEYPKCGGSWVRRILETYLDVQPYHFDRYLTPNTVVQLHRLCSAGLCNPIILYRDPRDVFVSFYFHERNQLNRGVRLAIQKYFDFEAEKDVMKSFQTYLRLKLTMSTEPFFTYQQFYDSWSRCNKKCAVTYERLHKDPVNELSNILTFLGVDLDQDKINHAIEYNTFEQVTKRKYGENRSAGKEDQTKFQRKGVTGDWLNYFNDESKELIEMHMGSMMREMGYL